MAHLAPIRAKLSANPPRPLLATTAYNFASAAIVSSCRKSDGEPNSGPDAGSIDIVFVMADEVARSSLGQEEGELTVEEMISHAKGVVRGAAAGTLSVNASNPPDKAQAPPLVVAELPRGSYELSAEQALKTALSYTKSIPTLSGVLLLGGKEIVPQITALTAAGIFTAVRYGAPTVQRRLRTIVSLENHAQSGNDTGPGVGLTVESARELLSEAQALDRAGASAILLEGVAEVAAEKIANVLGTPVIGLGCGRGPALSGQIVWMTECLTMMPDSGRNTWQKCFANITNLALSGTRSFVKEVLDGSFPTEENTCQMAAGEDAQLRKILAVSNRKQSFSMNNP